MLYCDISHDYHIVSATSVSMPFYIPLLLVHQRSLSPHLLVPPSLSPSPPSLLPPPSLFSVSLPFSPPRLSSFSCFLSRSLLSLLPPIIPPLILFLFSVSLSSPLLSLILLLFSLSFFLSLYPFLSSIAPSSSRLPC